MPAKRQGEFGNDHSLYKRKTDSWIKTNIERHTSRVRNSGRRGEIIALKVWRKRHNIEFPSFYLEIFTIDALHGRVIGNTAENFLFVLKYIRDTIATKRTIDPSNCNNILSNELSWSEKLFIANKAQQSLEKKCWEDIVW